MRVSGCGIDSLSSDRDYAWAPIPAFHDKSGWIGRATQGRWKTRAFQLRVRYRTSPRSLWLTILKNAWVLWNAVARLTVRTTARSG